MRNAIILHGTDATSKDNWFPWLKTTLEDAGWKVWVPDLPRADKPNRERYNTFLLLNKEFPLDEETVMIGHSSGAVAILGFLQELPDNVVIKRAILVSAFKNDLGWDSLKELFAKPLDFEAIKKHVHEITLIHADDDPYVPLEQAEYLEKQLSGKLIVLKGQKHFSQSMDAKYTEFPFIAELLKH